ncbi:MAG: hypothetical protein M1828_002121 [Chrysothrix sp. TS-e1954]|nr:MAG: hypothetical protein M1828_002121 [Chrysothrix sp. TS-e1954]
MSSTRVLLLSMGLCAIVIALPNSPSANIVERSSAVTGLKRQANSSTTDEVGDGDFSPLTLPMMTPNETISDYLDVLDGDAQNYSDQANITARDWFREKGSATRGAYIESTVDDSTYNITLSGCLNGASVMGTWTYSNGVTADDQTFEQIVNDLTSSYNSNGGGQKGKVAMGQRVLANVQQLERESVGGLDQLDQGVCEWNLSNPNPFRHLLDIQGRETIIAFVIILVTTVVTGPVVASISYGINRNQTTDGMLAVAVSTSCGTFAAGMTSYFVGRAARRASESAAIAAAAAFLRQSGRQARQRAFSSTTRLFGSASSLVSLSGNSESENLAPCIEDRQALIAAQGLSSSYSGPVRLRPYAMVEATAQQATSYCNDV